MEDGFQPIDPQGNPVLPVFSPPRLWRQLQDEWVLGYRRPGALSPFRLHCSLQAATGRMFIHASETGPDGTPLRDNIQVLGLQLTNYTSAEQSGAEAWEDAIQNERTLLEMVREFVLNPLWEHARKSPGGEIASAGAPSAGPSGGAATAGIGGALSSRLSSVTQRPAVTGAILVGLAATAAAAIVVMRYRSPPPASY